MLNHSFTELAPLYLVDGPDTNALGVDMDQAVGDKVLFAVPFPCVLEYVGAAVTETCAGGTTTPIVKFDKRPTAGSDSERGDGDAGSLVLATTAAGKFGYDDDEAGLALEPGEEIVCQLTVAATGTSAAGHIRPMVVVRHKSEVWGNLDNVVELTPA